MWLMLLGTAIAGPPFQGCDVQADGVVAFMAPALGEVLLYHDGTITPLTTVPMLENGGNHYVIFSREDGGWWVGAGPTFSVSPEGAVLRVDEPPAPMFAALGSGNPANGHPQGGHIEARVDGATPPVQSVVHVQDDNETVLVEVNAMDMFATMRGLYATDFGFWAIRSSVIAFNDADGKTKTYPMPTQDVFGVCASESAVYVVGDQRTPCLYELDGEDWSQLACYKK